jgi:hypothetical protein
MLQPPDVPEAPVNGFQDLLRKLYGVTESNLRGIGTVKAPASGTPRSRFGKTGWY